MNARKHANWTAWRRLGPLKFRLRWSAMAGAAAIGVKVFGPLVAGRPVDALAATAYVAAFTVLGYAFASWVWRRNETQYLKHQGTRA